MRVALFIRELMMDAVRGHPENRTPFQSRGSAESQEILQPPRGAIAAVGQQPVITDADPQAARNPPQQAGDEESFPGEEEQGCNRTDMEDGHEGCGYPIDSLVVGVSFEGFDLHVGFPGFEVSDAP